MTTPCIPAPGSIGSLQRRFPLWMPVLIVLFGFANSIATPLASTDGGNDAVYLTIMAVLFGCITAQTAVLALWLVWNEWPLPLKLSLHLLCGLFLFGCWGTGYLLALPAGQQVVRDLRVKELVGTACCLPALSLTVQTPLWIARAVFGWRVLHGDAPARADSKLSLRDLFTTTTIVAGSFACLRVAKWMVGADNDYWVASGVTGVVVVFVSAILLLPLVAITLRTNKHEAALGGALTWCIGLTIIVELPILVVMGAIGAARAPDAWLTVVVVTVYFASALATVAVPLAIARSQGYRLCFSGDAKRGDAQRGLLGRTEPS